MDAQLKAKWVEALRSGKYFQARGSLRNLSGDGKVQSFCCLGVLCDVLGAQWGRRSGDHDRAEEGCVDDMNLKASGASYLSLGLSERVRLSHDIQKELATKNDDGHDFSDIADWIEAVIPTDAVVKDAE